MTFDQKLLHLPQQRPWLFRICRFAFLVLISSFLLYLALSTFFVDPIMGCGAVKDKFSYVVDCEGFPFASAVEGGLNYFISLWMYAIFFPFIIIATFSGAYLAAGVLLYVIGSLSLDIFALIFIAHLFMRVSNHLKPLSK